MGKTSIVELEHRAKEIARRIIWRQPMSEIMRDLKLTKRMFDVSIASPFFKTIHSNLEKELWEDLDARHKTEVSEVQSKAREASVDAIETLIGLMRASPSEPLRRDCANDVIKYSGTVQNDRHAPNITISSTTISLLHAAIKDDNARDGNGSSRA